MRITTEIALHGVARTLRERIAPALHDDFAKEAARLAELVVTICANAVDNAAAVRVAENAAIRAIFAKASLLPLPDRKLAARLDEAAHSTDPGLRVSELDTENGRLRRLLVQFHQAVEDLTDEPARAVDRAIWQMLRNMEAARAPRS
jgi:hypothetical protein